MTLIENGDVCSLIFLLILLTFVGRFFVQHSPRLELLGLRIAAGVGILYALLNLSDENTATAGDITGLVLRSIATGGLVLGPSWIILSVGSYIFCHLDRWSDEAKAASEARRLERERRRQEAKERERQRLANLEWERQRPQRELEARLNAEREAAAKRLAEIQLTRRENARAACELLFTQHAPEIAERFPRAELDRFLRTYMGDGQAADEVERRGLELQRIIHEHRQHIQRDPPETIQGLAEWYLSERQRIEALPLDDDLKQTHLMQLDYRYAELSEQLLQRARP